MTCTYSDIVISKSMRVFNKKGLHKQINVYYYYYYHISSSQARAYYSEEVAYASNLTMPVNSSKNFQYTFIGLFHNTESSVLSSVF